MDEGNPVKYDRGPKLDSRSAIIVDLDSGEILYEKVADTRRPAASVTKVLASLTLADKGVDLDAEVCTDSRIRTGNQWCGYASEGRSLRNRMGLYGCCIGEFRQWSRFSLFQ